MNYGGDCHNYNLLGENIRGFAVSTLVLLGGPLDWMTLEDISNLSDFYDSFHFPTCCWNCKHVASTWKDLLKCCCLLRSLSSLAAGAESGAGRAQEGAGHVLHRHGEGHPEPAELRALLQGSAAVQEDRWLPCYAVPNELSLRGGWKKARPAARYIQSVGISLMYLWKWLSSFKQAWVLQKCFRWEAWLGWFITLYPQITQKNLINLNIMY